MAVSTFARCAILALAVFAVAPPPAALAQTSTMTPTKIVTKPVHLAAGKMAVSQKFSSAAAAQASCPNDTVVWSSFTSTHSFHLSTSKYYGKTKHGAYVCQQAALAAGFHRAKT